MVAHEHVPRAATRLRVDGEGHVEAVGIGDPDVVGPLHRAVDQHPVARRGLVERGVRRDRGDDRHRDALTPAIEGAGLDGLHFGVDQVADDAFGQPVDPLVGPEHDLLAPRGHVPVVAGVEDEPGRGGRRGRERQHPPRAVAEADAEHGGVAVVPVQVGPGDRDALAIPHQVRARHLHHAPVDVEHGHGERVVVEAHRQPVTGPQREAVAAALRGPELRCGIVERRRREPGRPCVGLVGVVRRARAGHQHQRQEDGAHPTAVLAPDSTPPGVESGARSAHARTELRLPSVVRSTAVPIHSVASISASRTASSTRA